MEKKKFITEREQTRIYKDHFRSWIGETYVKVKGICYQITTIKGSNGRISSSATKVNDEGTGNGFTSVSMSMSDITNSIKLGSEQAIATEKNIKAYHFEALAKFDAMADQLPSKDEAFQILPGQVVFLNGYGQDEHDHERQIIYKVDEFNYYYVNETTLAMGHDSLNFLKDIEDKHGIGTYYKKGDTVTIDFANSLVLDAIEKTKKDEAERPAKESAARAERAGQVAAIEKAWPQLLKPGKNSGGGTHVAKNLRIELKQAFPNTKFSITSSYSKVDVKWEDGPTKTQVGAITGKYEDHETDHTGDFRDYKPSLFNEVFGGCNFVFEERSYSHETEAKILAWAEEHNQTRREDINSMFYNLEIPAGDFTIVRNEQTHKWEAIPEGTPQPQTPNPKPNPKPETGIIIRRNEEKDGIEIKFPEHPGTEVIELLKLAGFRWSRFAKLWWVKYSDERWDFAQNISSIMA